MGIIHTPRVIGSILKGAYTNWRTNGGKGSLVGFGIDQPHVYSARLNLFDIDYLGHMNNAAYLTHAELSRWEMVAENGCLSSLVRSKGAFVVTGTSVRFRREVRPIFRKFHVDSSFIAISDRYIWSSHIFRHADPSDHKIRAQVLTKAAFVKKGAVQDPRDVLVNDCSMDHQVVHSLHTASLGSLELDQVEALEKLEESKKAAAAADDARFIK